MTTEHAQSDLISSLLPIFQCC